MKIEANSCCSTALANAHRALDTSAMFSISNAFLDQLKSILDHTESSITSNISSSDPLRMGDYWQAVKDSPPADVIDMIEKRRGEIQALKEQVQSHCIPTDRSRALFTPAPDGEGSAYFLSELDGIPRFVIKPMDEEIFCINNPKGHATPFVSSEYRLRPYIPLYTSVFNEVLSYETARIAGIENTVPRTTLEIISHPSFHDISDPVSINDVPWSSLKNNVDKEKICSVQEFVPNSVPLNSLVKTWLAENVTDEDILKSIDRDSFEDAMILVWLTFDNDAHSANFLAYPLLSSQNKASFGLKKIDNSLTFPEHNRDLFNFLLALPHAKFPLSERAKKIIAEIPMYAIADKMNELHRHNAIPAFLKRCEELKRYSDSSATVEEIHLSFKRELNSLHAKHVLTASSWIIKRQQSDDVLIRGLRKIAIKNSYSFKISRSI